MSTAAPAPTGSALTLKPCIWDEGFVNERACTIHQYGPLHVHLAVCPVCRRPLTADLKPAFCTDVFVETGWRCMYSPELNRDVKI